MKNKKLKKPLEPKAPKPNVKPSEMMNVFSNEHICCVRTEERMTIADFSMMVRAKLVTMLLPTDTPIVFEIDSDYDSYRADLYLYASVSKEVENPYFQTQLSAWEKREPHYQIELAAYKSDMIEYKLKLEAYHIELERIVAAEKEKEIASLEARLAELRK